MTRSLLYILIFRVETALRSSAGPTEELQDSWTELTAQINPCCHQDEKADPIRRKGTTKVESNAGREKAFFLARHFQQALTQTVGSRNLRLR